MDSTTQPVDLAAAVEDAARRASEPSESLFAGIMRIAGEKLSSVGKSFQAKTSSLGKIFTAEGGVALLGFGVQAVALAAIYMAVQHLRKR
jgi:hypothetical protein